MIDRHRNYRVASDEAFAGISRRDDDAGVARFSSRADYLVSYATPATGSAAPGRASFSLADLIGTAGVILPGDAVAYSRPSTVPVPPLTIQTNTVYKAGVPSVRTNTVDDYTALLWPTKDPAIPLYTINGITGKPAFITYSFPTQLPSYVVATDDVTQAALDGFKPFTADEQQIVRTLLGQVSAAAGIVFLEVPGVAEMPFMHIDFSKRKPATAGGFAAAPGNGGLSLEASDVFMDEHPIKTVDVILHEIGHAIGLQHPHDGTGGTGPYGRMLATQYDNVANTIMSYENKAGTGLGPLDIQALRFLYGNLLPDAGTDYSWNATTQTLRQASSAGNDALYGTFANDIIDGGSGDDTLVGKSGRNELSGADGNDTITGGANTDIFKGGAGNDTLKGSSGTVDYDGGAGNDTLEFTATAGKTFKVDGGADVDALKLIINDASADAITLVNAVTNVETIDVFAYTQTGGTSARSRGITMTANDAKGSIKGGDGDDILNGSNGQFALWGGKGDDTIVANGNVGNLDGEDGNDTLRAGTASGNLFGGAGADKFFASAAASYMAAGITPGNTSDGATDTFYFENASYSTETATDTIGDFRVGEDKIDLTGLGLTHYAFTYNGASSFITGTAADGTKFKLAINAANVTTADVIGDDGFSSNQTIIGTAAGDTLTGGASDDRIDGKGGADRLTGGAGADTFVVSASGDSTAAAPDTILDFVRGTDRIDLTGLDLTSYAFRTVGNTTEITGIASQNTANETTFKLVVNTPGVTAADVIGDDGFAVDRTITGTSGNDNDGGAGRLLGGRANDTIKGLAGNDLIFGMEGDDVIEGGAGADHLIGGNGNGGTPQPDPTLGNDVFLYTSASDSIEGASDFIQDFAIGQDKIRFSGMTLGSYAITTVGSSTVITGVENGVKFLLTVGTPGLTTADIEGDESFSTDVTKMGDGFDNTLEGGTGNDTLAGLGGNDILRGLGGADKLDGGTGNDTLEVTVGTNRTGFAIDGGADADTLRVFFADVDAVAHSLKLSELGIRNVEDVVDVRSGEKNDTLTADIAVSGSITMSGWGGNDVLSGSAGRDVLWGGDGNDTLTGNDGDDVLNGQQGIEKLYGGRGNDSLTIDLGFLVSGRLPAGYVLDGGDGYDTLTLNFVDPTTAKSLVLSPIQTTGIEKIVANGGTANDTLDARNVAADTDLIGGTGLATLYGGNGKDDLRITLGTPVAGNAPAGYVLNGGVGDDTLHIDFADRAVAHEFNVKSLTTTNIETIIVTGGDQKDALSAAGLTIRTDLSGLGGDDTLTAGSAGGNLWGGAGNDRLVAGSGANFMGGGDGDDTFVFGKITDSVRGSSDTIGDFVRGADKIDVTAIRFDAGTFTINRTSFTYSDGSTRIGTEIIGKANGSDFYVQVQDVHLDESDFVTKIVNGVKKLSDGYIAGATVFYDANDNGALDDGEDFAFTDDQGNFELPAGGIGPIRGFGGINIDTGLPNLLMLSAPGDALVVDPLTTLVQSLVGGGESEAAATAQVKAAFGLADGIILGQTDLIAAADAGDADALAAQKIAASIATVIVVGAAGGNDASETAGAVLAALVAVVAQGGAIDLTSGSVLERLYDDAGLGDAAVAAAASAAAATDAIASAGSVDDIAGAQKDGALTGNDLDNVLTGGTAADTLHGYGGADRLDGGAGDDTLVGGIGDDAYVVDSAGDVVVERRGEGADTVYAGVDYRLGDQVENLTLTGTAARGQGNALDNVITGNDGANRLIGGGGMDTLVGGAGDDVYRIGDIGDHVVEAAGGGSDKVVASIDYALDANVEKLRLTGTATAGTGNELDNRLIGGSLGETLHGLAGDDVLVGNAGNDMLDGGTGRDVLIGGTGADILTGGAGRDIFRFVAGDLDTVATGSDLITDFTPGEDQIDLRRIDAIRGGADDAFGFIGTAAFSGHAGELRYFVAGNETILAADIDGDSQADFELHLSGPIEFRADDFRF